MGRVIVAVLCLAIVATAFAVDPEKRLKAPEVRACDGKNPWCYVTRASVRIDPKSVTSTLRDEEVVDLVGDPQHLKWAFVDKHHFSCFNAAYTDSVFGTPGGDLGEFLIAVAAYEELTGNRLNPSEVSEILVDYLQYANERPTFRWCTDSKAVESLEAAVGAGALNVRNPPVDVRNRVLEQLTNVKAIGDSHLRAAIQEPGKYYMRPQLVSAGIQAFYELLWQNHPKVKLDMLKDDAAEPVAVISVTTGSECFSCGVQPLVAPNNNAKKPVIINTPDATQLMRHQLATFIARRCQCLDVQTLKAKINTIAGVHYLAAVDRDANHIPSYAVEFS